MQAEKKEICRRRDIEFGDIKNALVEGAARILDPLKDMNVPIV